MDDKVRITITASVEYDEDLRDHIIHPEMSVAVDASSNVAQITRTSEAYGPDVWKITEVFLARFKAELHPYEPVSLALHIEPVPLEADYERIAQLLLHHRCFGPYLSE